MTIFKKTDGKCPLWLQCVMVGAYFITNIPYWVRERVIQWRQAHRKWSPAALEARRLAGLKDEKK